MRLVLEQRREHRSLGASIHAGIGMPQLLSVGQDYHQGGIASFGINPGVGSGGAYKEARVNALEPSGRADIEVLFAGDSKRLHMQPATAILRPQAVESFGCFRNAGPFSITKVRQRYFHGITMGMRTMPTMQAKSDSVA